MSTKLSVTDARRGDRMPTSDLIISSHLFLIEIALDHIRSHVAEGVILSVGDRAELFNLLNRDSD